MEMKKTLSAIVAVFACVLITAMASGAGKGFRVSGEVVFHQKGIIKLQLCDRNNFKDDDDKDEASEKDSAYTITLRPGDADIKNGRMPFSFDGISEGKYLIQGFLDTNGNGRCDEGLLGPKEPWGFCKREKSRMREPEFDEISFEVKGDMTGLNIELR
jgi:uncharacterized protein (DUF2141 family)